LRGVNPMWVPEGEEWWLIWVFVTWIEFAWMGWLHNSQKKISTNIKDHPTEVVVVESIIMNEDIGEEE